ncbi:MAG: PIN domain-containing protein [Armatimonadetes bacterium]|nr:PIN domain-containing protein [Armatimonadota bacterium]
MFTGRNRVHLSYVTVAEIKVIADRNQWGLDKRSTLADYLRRFIAVNVGGDLMLDAYIAIEAYNYYEGRDMGSKNDLWIAATARVHRMTLITTDKDFIHLRDTFISVAYMDPVKGVLTNDFDD